MIHFRIKRLMCLVGQISDLPKLFFIAFRDPHGHDTVKAPCRRTRGLAHTPGRPITNRPQIDNLPHVVPK